MTVADVHSIAFALHKAQVETGGEADEVDKKYPGIQALADLSDNAELAAAYADNVKAAL
jgi:hypothetical protein